MTHRWSGWPGAWCLDCGIDASGWPGEMSPHDERQHVSEMPREISQTYDGVWRTPPRKDFYRACCDCGLVHREEYRVRNGKVQYRVWRDKAETQLERRRTGKGKRR